MVRLLMFRFRLFPGYDRLRFRKRRQNIHKPTYSEMKKLVIDVDPVRVSAKTKGFYAVTKVQPVTVDDDEEDEAARAV